jgi:hypothetical protein
MTNAIVYFGALELNFRNLKPGTCEYVHADGERVPAKAVGAKVDGILFAYMEGPGKRFFAVRAEDVVLEHVVELVPRRHTDGKGFGPKPTHFGDASAYRLLSDMLAANPGKRDQLGELLASLPRQVATE